MSARLARGLRVRYAEILAHTGTVGLITGAVLASPALAALAFQREWSAVPAFLVSGGLLSLSGWWLRRLVPVGAKGAIGLGDASVVILFSWVLAVAFAAVPFMWVGGLDLTEAIFEATSGWTTTGLTVIRPEGARPSILLLRSTLQLAGGAGLAILMVSALLGPPGVGLTRAEGRGEQLVPLVSRSASLVVRIYAGYTVVGILLLRMVGMGWFDAVNHSFAAVSTGGFSTKDANIGYWDSAAVEAVIIVLMFLGNLSFVTAYRVLRGRWRAFTSSGEVRLFTVLLAVGFVILLLGVMPGQSFAPPKEVRVALFEAATALTTTGFQTVGYGPWPGLGWWVLILLMIVGGGTDSTAGGLKQHRVYLLYRFVVYDLRRRLGPRRAANEFSLPGADGPRYYGFEEVASVGVFTFFYLVVLAMGTVVISAHGFGLRESLFEFASALGTVGTSVGVTSPDAPGVVLWTETLGMLLGRLEFYSIFVAVGVVLADVRLGLAGSNGNTNSSLRSAGKAG